MKLTDDNPLEATETAIGEIAVDREAEVPIGIQLAWALRSRIGDGRLAPGMRLPGLREFAETTGVNVNTVRAVYQRLEHEGLIDSQHGSGTFVSANPPRPSAASNIAAQAASEARATGVDPRAVAAALYVSPEAPAGVAEEERERRRLLRAQIGSLERTLGEMQASHPALVVAPAPGRARRGPSLLDATALEDVRTELVRRLATMQAAIDAEATAAQGTSTEESKAAAQPSRKPASGRRPAKRPNGRPATAT
jgi:DNA-binding transcriptional regulator YhcF (GntR family)